MTDRLSRFHDAFVRCPLVAILRGITPAEVDAVGDVLVDAGFTLIEVPLNSPDPLVSIERLARRLEGRAMVGGGTVLTPQAVSDVRSAGGELIISPNTNTAVIAATGKEDLISMPGYFTPSEAFAALAAGAHVLKLFPAEAASPDVLKAQRAVLPRNVPLMVVGGVSPAVIPAWAAAGANGFGLGSGLYRAGKTAAAVATDAQAFVDAVRTVSRA